MKIKIQAFLTAVIISAVPHFISAQAVAPCGTDEIRRQLVEQDPGILTREAEFDAYAANFAATNHTNQRSTTYVIPVVFHIIHDYGTENISDEQIYDAIDKMNEDYSKSNADFLETAAEFQDVAADVQIEFRLAKRTLSGECTTGIERIPSLRTYTGGDAAKLDGWQPAFYLNIWVVETLAGNAAAYAYYPTSISGYLIPADGIICLYNYVGSIGASGSYGAHTLSHEAGHYLNLQHCWGNTNQPGVACGDDQVSDTPPTEGWTSCNLAGATCNNDVDNVQNFMEYSYCSTMFTEGQKTRMYASLSSPIAYRDHLVSEENLELTGTNDGYVAGLCSPKADFYADNRFVCSGETVNFHDVSWGGAADSRNWEFEGGSPSASTELNPAVTFTEAGWHKVSMTANNASGSNTSSIDQYIYVSSETPELDASYYANFNDGNEVNDHWVFYNKYPDDREWKWLPTNGYWSGGCAMLNSRFGPSGETDVLISPAFNLSDGLASNIFFKYSTTTYAPDDDSHDMALKLYYSVNCGRTWIYISQITGDDWQFSYGGGIDFYPTQPDQWTAAIFNMPSGAQQENVRFKIEYVYNAYSNNVFIDDFNFTTYELDVASVENISGLTVHPNPSTGNHAVEINYALAEGAEIVLTVTDLTGSVVYNKALGMQSSGLHQFDLIPSALNMHNGCYFVKLRSENTEVNSKLVVF